MTINKKKKRTKRQAAQGHDNHHFETSIQSILLKPDEVPEPGLVKNLHLIIGFNKSDNTFGWNGFNNALHLYYSDWDEEFMAREHAIALVGFSHRF